MTQKKAVIIFDWDDTLLDARHILMTTQRQAIASILQEKTLYPFTKNWCVPDNCEFTKHMGHRFKEKVVLAIMPDLDINIINQLESVNNIAVVCVIAKLKKPVTENFWLNINDPEMDIPGLVEYSNLRPLDDHLVYVPFYMPGDNPKFLDDNQVFLDKVKKYLKIINKDLCDDDFIQLRASRYRFAQPICEPNFLSKLPPTKLPTKGLWVADTSYYYPEDRGISESIDFGRSLARDALL